MLTFVVYYRIHLNLNLEASARQWPNDPPPPPSAVEKFCPANLAQFCPFCHLPVFFTDLNNRPPSTERRFLHSRRNSTDLEGLLNVLEHFLPENPGFQVVVLNGVRPDNVPLSLRDTVTKFVHKVTLAAGVAIYSPALIFQDV